MKSAEALTRELIDYAGLFPPAQLDMDKSVRNYADYLAGPYSAMLGRFILPASRLAEFDKSARELLPRSAGSLPWKLSVLMTTAPDTEITPALKFNCEHWAGSDRGHCVIDTIEAKASTPREVMRTRSAVPDFYRLFLEVPLVQNGEILDAIREAGCGAKIRTGGTDAGAFPPAPSVAEFLAGCKVRNIPFKATAGLHHAVCASYPLTYEAGSATARMFGFVNVFAAAVFLFSGTDTRMAAEILDESGASAFRFRDDGLYWRDVHVTTDEISRARGEFAISFGSCSFAEPVEEFTALS